MVFNRPKYHALSELYRKGKKKKKCISILECWKFRRLPLLGKIVVLKSLVALQLVYILSPLQTNHEATNEINSMFYAFLGNGKGDKVKRKVMNNDYTNGGLKILDIASFNKALKVVCIKKDLDAENNCKWKCFFDLQLEKFGGNALPKGNVNLKDIKDLKISATFVKKKVEIWSEVCFVEKITSDDHFLSSPLLHNSLIRIQNKPVMYYDWISKGITQVKHLLDDSCRFRSLQTFQNTYDFQVRPLSFFGVISTIGTFLHFMKQTCEIEKKNKTVEQQERNRIFWCLTYNLKPKSPQHRSVFFVVVFLFLFFYFCDLDWLYFPTVLYTI